MIICVYSTYRRVECLHAVIHSLRRQSIQIDIVLSEQAELGQEAFASFARQNGLTYVSSRPEYTNGEVRSNIGQVRNVGASVSCGRYLYFSDADVLFLSSSYIETLWRDSISSPTRIYFRPKMYRLRESAVSLFIKHYIDGKPFILGAENREPSARVRKLVVSSR